MKKRLFPLALAGVIVLTIVGSAYWGYDAFTSFLIRDFACKTNPSDGRKIDIVSARDALHRNLRWPLYGHHDAFLLAGNLGNKHTVPLLITALKHEGDIDPDAKRMICVRAHLLDSLHQLTQANPGVNYADWKKWYEQKNQELTKRSR